MPRSDRPFILLFVAILVLGGSAVVIALNAARRDATAEGAQMAASAAAMRDLLELHYAMGRYRIEGLQDGDGDGTGEYATLAAVHAAAILDPDAWRLLADGGLQRGGYRYRAILPAGADDAEIRFAVVALPADAAWPVLAVDEVGDLRAAPPGFRPDPRAPVDPHDWPLRR